MLHQVDFIYKTVHCAVPHGEHNIKNDKTAYIYLAVTAIDEIYLSIEMKY